MEKLTETNQAPNFTYNTPFEKGLDFYGSLASDNNYLIFSRYIGCSLCQLKMLEMKEDYKKFEEKGAKIFFVLQSTEATAKEQISQMEIPYTVILDPDMELYKLYNVSAAKSKAGLLSPKVLKMIDEAKKRGLEHGEYEGEELQLPAAFIIDGTGVIQYAKYAKNLGDLPTNEKVISLFK